MYVRPAKSTDVYANELTGRFKHMVWLKFSLQKEILTYKCIDARKPFFGASDQVRLKLAC